MSQLAIGMIETFGLVAGIQAADAAIKSANVKFLGYELTKGNGLVTIKFVGDVAATKAALEAGSIAAEKINKVWSKLVIPRPHDEIEKLIKSHETVGDAEKTEKEEKVIENLNKNKDLKVVERKVDNNFKEEAEEKKEVSINKLEKEKKELCNICKDQLCTRKKGEARNLCIHYKIKKEE